MQTILRRGGANTLARPLLLVVLALATLGGPDPAAAQGRRTDLVALDPGRLAQGFAPTIDGNGEDLITFAAGIGANGCAVDRTDSRDDITIADPKIIVCGVKEDTNADGELDYFINGFDLRRFVFVYDRPNQTIYLLWRQEGFVGDVDGNGNPDDAVCPPTIPSFGDEPGIGSQENYQARIDTNCDGLPDITIAVGGTGTDQVTVTGTASGTSTLAYRVGAGTGKDLEVRITGVSLPPVFRINANTNASFDGLGEDIAPTTECGVASPSIDLQKSVLPAVICPGQTADFTLIVTNNGNVDLTGVTVVDNLPAPLAFVSTVSNTCGGAVNQVGNQITYGPFNLAASATCTIVIRASRSAECAGEQTNHASVEGTFQSPCVNGGEPIVVSDQASATLLCGNVTCSITASANAVCAGQTVELCGPAGFTYAWHRNGVPLAQTTQCIQVGAGTYTLVITDPVSGCVSNNPCAVTIAEKSPPCATVTADGPATACPGDAIQVCGTVTNCGDRAADLEVRLGALTRSFPAVPPTESRPFCFDLVMPDCTNGGADFAVVATATNDCGTDTVEDVVRVACGECERCLGVLILDEETIDNDIHSIEDAAGPCGLTPDRLVNDDRPREVGNLPLRWNTVCPGGIVTLPSGQLFDEGVFALPSTIPWSLEAFVAGTVPQNQLDKIANVNPLQTPELQLLEGCSFVAVVYDSDISMNYGPTNGNLQGARLGLFFFTVLDVIPPGTLPESGSSSSQWDLVIRVDPAPTDYCVAAPFADGQCAGGDAVRTPSIDRVSAPIAEADAEVKLYRASPNPFSVGTRFAFEVAAPNGADVSVAVYDAAGRKIRTVAAGLHAAGRHVASWDGRTDAGVTAPRGVYFVRTLIAGENMPVQRVLFVR